MCIRGVLLSLGWLVWPTEGWAADSPFDPVVTEILAAAKGGEPTAGNRVMVLEGGYDALLARVHLIRNARRSIEVQTFIWTNDEVGRLVMWELIEAARRGAA